MSVPEPHWEWEVLELSLNNTVLFSAIGATDPVRDNFDGPMLHIARHYRPKKVYLYFSEEMAEMEYKDNK